jgi:hypothetical protein
MRIVLTLLGVLAVGSIALVAMWTYAGESRDATEVARGDGAVASAPESRSIFPKVLNR